MNGPKETGEARSCAAPLPDDRAIDDLVSGLDSPVTGKAAAEGLVAYGPSATEPLRRFLLEGVPRKIFQPRLWAVETLARLGAKDALLEYLFQEKTVLDPEDRFGEEAVESAAARFLAAWPQEDVYRALLELSDRKMLVGLIEALAGFGRPESIPFFERALEDDFYRPAAEEAFVKMGARACSALAHAAVSPKPSLVRETPSSLQRRRSSASLLGRIGMEAKLWPALRVLLDDPDTELFIAAARLGVQTGSKDDRATIARGIVGLLSSVPWNLREEVERILVVLGDEAAIPVDEEIARRMSRPEAVRAADFALRSLLKVRQKRG
jgi:HEAT repeat protein